MGASLVNLGVAGRVVSTAASRDDGPLADAQGRRITYLRLSITDRCNYRCVYCSPANWGGKHDYLSSDELVRLVTVFASLGVRRVRLTGGEPLLRPDVVDIAARVRAVPGIDELCLTTNGHHLAALAPALKAAGVDKVNVSIDTTDPALFRELTVRGDLAHVVDGLQAASRAGFPRLAVNAVVIPGQGDDGASIASLVRLAWSNGAVPRFIELMPFAGAGEPVPSAELRRRLESVGFTFVPAPSPPGAGPARYVAASDGESSGEIGFISAMTENFCDACNRVRLTSKGELRACLGGRDQVALAPLLRTGADDAQLRLAIRNALGAKWDGHRFHEGGDRLLSMMGAGG